MNPYITNKGEKVVVAIDSDHLKMTFFFYHERSAEVDARLLGEHLSNAFHKRIEEIRKVEYQQGWKDAKAKRKKREWFLSTLYKP